MMTMNWDYLLNSTRITNPFKGNEPFMMSPSRFHHMFANTLTRAESDAAYARYAVHDSRKVLRDCLGEDGKIDTTAPHVPLLFVSGLCDKVIPAKLNRKNAEAWTDPRSVVDFKEFEGRSHLIIAQDGWEAVASDVAGWLEQQVRGVNTVV
jgi:pimeloyl-ACP methyl ester carboxylesterase